MQRRLDSIRLTWNDRAFTEDGYEIERSPDGSAWLSHDSVGTDIDSYLIPANENTTWYYRVSAFEGGTSDWSNEDSATTPAIDSDVDKRSPRQTTMSRNMPPMVDTCC